MAKSVRNLFHSMQPALLWAKFQSLFQGEEVHENNSNINGQKDSNSEAEQEAALDLEAGIRFQKQPAYVHGNISSSSSPSHSSPLSINSTPGTSPAPQRGSLLPICTRPSFSSHSSPLSSSSSQNSSPGLPQGGLNPVAQIFKDQDLGKVIIGFLMPLAAVFLTPYAPTSLLVRKLVFLSLSFGLAALWNGILLRNIFPRRANFIEQIGAAFVLLAFYGLISSFLPEYYLQWIPWACFVVVLLPFFWSYYLGIN